MRIIDPEALSRARQRRYCEVCGREGRGQLHAAHVFAKGMGSGKRIDADFNLAGLCFRCHAKHHSGELKTATLLLIVARREGRTAESITDEIHAIRRQPKTGLATSATNQYSSDESAKLDVRIKPVWSHGIFADSRGPSGLVRLNGVREMEFHPICEEFPRIEGEAREQLKADLKKHGPRLKGLRWKGLVVDGKNRAELCNELGIDFPVEDLPDATTEEEMTNQVASLNFHRRDLSASQRAIIAAKLLTQSVAPGENGSTQTQHAKEDAPQEVTLPPISKTKRGKKGSGRKTDKAGKKAKVSGKSVRDAKVVLEKGTPAIAKAVRDGKISVSKAVKAIHSGAKTAEEAMKRITNRQPRKPPTPTENGDLDADPEPEEDKTVEGVMKSVNSAIESFCRGVIKHVEDNLPDDHWIDHQGLRNSVLQKFRDACSALRTAKCVSVCPLCNGDGCGHGGCYGTGRLPKYNYDLLVKS